MTSIYHGYTESEEKIALRTEKRKAAQIVHDVSPQMDEFLNRMGACINNPNAVLQSQRTEEQTLSGWNAIAAKHAPKPRVLKAFIDCTHPNEYPTMNGMHC